MAKKLYAERAKRDENMKGASAADSLRYHVHLVRRHYSLRETSTFSRSSGSGFLGYPLQVSERSPSSCPGRLTAPFYQQMEMRLRTLQRPDNQAAKTKLLSLLLPAVLHSTRAKLARGVSPAKLEISGALEKFVVLLSQTSTRTKMEKPNR